MDFSRLAWPLDAFGATVTKTKHAQMSDLGPEKNIKDQLQELVFLLFRSGEQKRETVEAVNGFAFSFRLDAALARSYRLDGGDEFRKHIGLRDGDVVRAQHKLQFRRKRRNSFHGVDVSIEIGFRAVQPDRARIVGVAGEEQSVDAIEEADGVRRVTGSRNDFECAAAEIDPEAIVNRVGDFPGFRRVYFWIETFWQCAANFIGGNFRLRVLARTFRIRPREFVIHAVDESELPVAADVIVVGM